jgi:zinc protease
MKRLVLPLAGVSLLAACASDLPDKPLPEPYELSQRDFPLKSGLRVVVQEDHSAPVIAAVSTFMVGSTQDPVGKEGLAHFVEHLAFRTRFADGLPIMDRLKHMGAEFNATTWWDFTNYFSTASKDYLEELMQQEAWRILHILDGVTPQNFATEKEVVRNELRLGNESSVGSKSFDILAEALYPPDHPMHRPTIGTHASLDAITFDDVKAWVKKYYRPENCTMVIAGDVDAKFVGKLLGTWPAQLLFGPGGPDGPAVARPPLIADQPTREVPEPVNRTLVRERGPVSTPTLMVAWAGPPGLRHNDALLDFVADQVSGAFETGVNFRDDDDIEALSGASAEKMINGTMFVVEANLRPGADPERARTRILDALVKAWTSEFSAAETELGRSSLFTEYMLRTTNLTGNAVDLGKHMAATGSSSFFKDKFEELAKIQAGEISQIAYKYVKRERSVALFIEPESEQAAQIVGGGEAGASGGKNSEHQIGHELDKTAKDLSSSRILKIARSPELAKLPRWKLSNGLEVVAAPKGTAPIASVMVGLKGGDIHTRPFGLASYADMFAQRRCFEHGGLDAVGGRLSRSTGAIGSTYFVSVMSGNLSNGLAVLSDSLACREVNEEAFLQHDRILERRSKLYQRAAKMPDFIASQKLMSSLYPDHPFGVVGLDPGTLKPITYEDAAAYVRGHYRPGNAVAVVVGKVDPEKTKELTDKYLAKWSGGGGTQTAIAAPPPPAARKAFLVDRPQGTQANVRIACRLADATAETLPLFDLAEAIATEQAWSVREEWGASYGVYASTQTYPGGASHMMVGGAITNKFVGQSVDRLLGILAQLDSGKLDEKFFLAERWEVARKFQQRFTTGTRIAGAILEAAEHGWPDDVWDKYPERLAAANRQDVRSVMKNCVGHEIITITGNAAEIRPQLKAIGLKLEAN